MFLSRRAVFKRALAGAFMSILVLAAPSWAGRKLWVVSWGGAYATPIDIGTETAGTPIDLGSGAGPSGAAISPDGSTLWIGEYGYNQIARVNLSTRSITQIGLSSTFSINNNPRPQASAVSPDGTKVYVGNQFGGFNNADQAKLAVVDAGTNAVTAIDIAGSNGKQSFTPDGTKAYVPSIHGLKVIDVATNAITASLTLPGGTGNSSAITPDGRTLLVVVSASDTVVPVDVATNTVGTPIAVGANPTNVAISPDGRTAYTSNYNGGSITPIDIATLSASPAVTGVPNARDVTFAPDGKSLYVLSQPNSPTTSKVYPIDAATQVVGSPIDIGTDNGIDFAMSPNQAPIGSVTAPAAAPTGGATFDASGSSDPDGSVGSYDWSWGDGTSSTTASAVATHEYPTTGGSFTARLTAIDAEGCSSTFVFTGQTAYCNGKATASVTRAITTPGAATGAAGDVAASSATLRGTVNPQGQPASYRFDFGTTTSYGSRAADTDTSAGSDSATHPESQAISGLAPNTTYHFRIVAIGASAVTNGADQVFTTNPLAPGTTTGDVSGIGRDTATVSGSIDPHGVATSYHFEYGTGAEYGSSTPEQSLDSGARSQTVSAQLHGLAPGASYHVRLVATSAGGTASGGDVVFTTMGLPPELNGLSADRRCVRGVTLTAPGPGHHGLSFAFSLSQNATVRYKVLRRVGSPKWTSCPPRRGTTTSTYSTVWQRDSTETSGEHHTALAGAASRHSKSGRLHLRRGARRVGLARIAAGRHLVPGTYVLQVSARNANGTSATSTVKFWVLGPRH